MRENLFAFIPTERIVIDLLHMFLRISDRLITNACELALIHEYDNSNPDTEDNNAEAVWLTDTFGRGFGALAHCKVKITQDDKTGVWTTSRLNGNKRKLIVREFQLNSIFKKNPVLGAQLQATWDGFWALYSVLNQKDPLLSIINAFRQVNEEELITGDHRFTTAQLRKKASYAWVILAQTWLMTTVMANSDGDNTLQPATVRTFITPYVHVFVFHVHSILIWTGSLNDFSCQNLELANNLQGKQTHRQNCRRSATGEEEMQIIMASFRNLLNIPPAVNSKTYKRRFFCPFGCENHGGNITLNFLRRHVNGDACQGKLVDLTPDMIHEVIEDSFRRHFDALAKGSCSVIVEVQAEAKEHFELTEPEANRKQGAARRRGGVDKATRKRYFAEKILEKKLAVAIGASERERISILQGKATLIPDAETRNTAIRFTLQYGDMMLPSTSE
jgi:hypothetical protein